ncbi:hypothetical protein NPIL_479571 [Nephila pilipes]|uniref:Uncharacterized protein n=1 Tax=Nephila pilipes TaxID=299642 RepID=A0A8X6QC68_NEPPI|nr:hypothetical protein NPIL_479571 [Nephila pilipes]
MLRVSFGIRGISLWRQSSPCHPGSRRFGTEQLRRDASGKVVDGQGSPEVRRGRRSQETGDFIRKIVVESSRAIESWSFTELNILRSGARVHRQQV